MEIGRVKLSRPIKTYDGEVTELVLKEPSGRVFLKHGDPVRRVSERTPDMARGAVRVETIIDWDKLRAYISDASGIDPIHLDQASPRDLDRAGGVILAYLDPPDPKTGEASPGN